MINNLLISGESSHRLVTVEELVLDLDQVPFLYFSRGNRIYRKNLLDFYLLDEPDLVVTLERRVVSMTSHVER